MVFGTKFPWGKAHEAFKNKSKSAPPKFDPFGDEDVAISPMVVRKLESLSISDIPLPPYRNGLKRAVLNILQPRPVRERALRDALDRFEVIAQSSDETDDDNFASNRVASPCQSETDDIDVYAIRLVTPRPSQHSPIPFWDLEPFIAARDGFPSFGFYHENRSLRMASIDISVDLAEDDLNFHPVAASSPFQPEMSSPVFPGGRDFSSPSLPSFLDLSPRQSQAFGDSNDAESRSASPSPLPSPGSPAQCAPDWFIPASDIDAKFRLFDNEAWSDSMCAEVEEFINAED